MSRIKVRAPRLSPLRPVPVGRALTQRPTVRLVLVKPSFPWASIGVGAIGLVTAAMLAYGFTVIA